MLERWLPPAASSYAGDIDGLLVSTIVVVGASFIAAEALLLFSAPRFRRRAGQRAAYTAGDRLRVMSFALVPCAVILCFDLFTDATAPPASTAIEETRQAYPGTTVLPILLPLALLATLGGWLRLLARRRREPGAPDDVPRAGRASAAADTGRRRLALTLGVVKANPLAHGFSLLGGFTYLLIVLGALVRANNAGLACPDWPLCFGELLPQLDLKVALEWGHRALAGSVTLGLVGLTWAARTRPEIWTRLRSRLAVNWALLATQIVFGGLTVLLLLAPWTVSVHLLLGNSFFAVLVWTALDLYQRDRPSLVPEPLSPSTRVLTATTVTLLILQLALGGLVASHYAGLACSAFPTCNGDSIAPQLTGLVGLHVLHRLNGVALLSSFLLLALTTRRGDSVGQLARTGTRLVAVQMAIGVADVLLRLPVELTALHSAMAAAIALTTALLAREVVTARAELRCAAQPMRVVEAG
jgi:cytochrome c oxidase assembly protein subunit 15